jgi:hypothetical protein
MFLHDHAPQLRSELGHGFPMATTRVTFSCYQEPAPFDEIVIRMRGLYM